MSACIVRSANPIGFLHISHKHTGTGLHFSHRFRTEFAHGSHRLLCLRLGARIQRPETFFLHYQTPGLLIRYQIRDSLKALL